MGHKESNQNKQNQMNSDTMNLELLNLQTHMQGFFYFSEVRARGLLNLEKAFGSSKLGKFDAV